MQVLINALALGAPLTGVGRYTEQLCIGLEQHPEVDQIVYFAHALVGTRSAVTQRLHGKPQALTRELRRSSLLNLMVRKCLTYATAIRLGHFKDYLYHETNFVLQPFRGKSIATIHDLSYVHFPMFHPLDRIKHMERGMPRTLRQARHFIAVSEFVKAEIVQLLNIAPGRITVTSPGVGPEYRCRHRDEINPTLKRYHLYGKRYILAVGSLDPRKNLLRLLEAFSKLPMSMKKRFTLVHVGPSGWHNEAIVKKIDSLIRQGLLLKLPYIPATELPLIYAGAEALLFPSLYEGFGLPPLEAMASGVPVLAADRAAIPEVVGNAGLLVNPEDVDAMAMGLQCLLEDDRLRTRLIGEGLERASRFTWQDCVKRTVDVYKTVLAE